MPREFTRAERVSDAVQQEVAVLIRDEVRDPRVGMVNITDVEISRDLAYGKIFVTFVEEREQQQIDEGIAALNGAPVICVNCWRQYQAAHSAKIDLLSLMRVAVVVSISQH